MALKKVKMEKEKEGFPLTSVREITLLLGLRHPSVVTVLEVVVGRSLDSIFMVMEFMEHDLKGLLEAQRAPLTASEVKCYLRQLLSGVAYLHDHYVLHRDLKTSNVLVSNRGALKARKRAGSRFQKARVTLTHAPPAPLLQLCDFGMARQYGSPLRCARSSIRGICQSRVPSFTSLSLRLTSPPLRLPPKAVHQHGGHPVVPPPGAAAGRGPLQHGGGLLVPGVRGGCC